MDITNLASSPSGVNYLPTPLSRREDIACFNNELEAEYIRWLENESSNRSVLGPRKRLEIRWHLQNPTARVPDDYTAAEKKQFANYKYEARNKFLLQDSQVYRRPEGSIDKLRYAACVSDSFAIISRVHCALFHYGIYLKLYL
jgi:hypothetical protein